MINPVRRFMVVDLPSPKLPMKCIFLVMQQDGALLVIE